MTVLSPSPAIPQPAVLAVVLRGDAALLVRRRNPPNAGAWGYPGGRIESGETIAAAALRELREETGVEAEFVRVLTALDSISDEREAAAGGALWHYVLVACLCRWRAGEPVAADDALEAGWFPLSALPAPLIEQVRAVARLAQED